MFTFYINNYYQFLKTTIMKKIYLACLCALALTGCNNEELNEFEPAQKQNTPQELLNITYKGVTYRSVPTTYDEEGDFVFLDEEFSKIYTEALSKNLHWSIALNDAYNITFYDDLETNLKAHGIEICENSFTDISVLNTRADSETLAMLELYDDRDFKDRRYYPSILNRDNQSTELADFKKAPGNFNDKTSSLIVTNNVPYNTDETFNLHGSDLPCYEIDAVFIGYDDKGFSGRSITVVAHAADVVRHSSLLAFNDKLSSFRFFFAQRGQYGSSI